MKIRRLLPAICRTALGLLLVVLPISEGKSAGNDPGPQPVERLVIRYHEGTFELVARTTIQKVITPSMTLADTSRNMSGSWFELQTSTGVMLYGRPLSPPNIAYVEHLADSTTGRIERQEIMVSERTFLITVPQRADGARVAIYGHKTGSADKAAASQVLGYIQLR